MFSNDLGWMVGEAGAILRWDGKQWKAIRSPVDVSLSYVKAVASDDAWAVGFSIANSNTLEREYILLRWNGVEWSIFNNLTPFKYVLDMSFVDGDDGWAILSDDSSNGHHYLMHWDGTTWTTIRETSDRFYAIKMFSKEDGWLIGTTTYLWNGRDWQEYSAPELKGYSLSLLATDDGWAVGGDELMLHWNGSHWEDFPLRNFSPTQVEMVSSTDGWVIGGEHGSGCEGGLRLKLLRWDGQQWKSPASNLPNRCYGPHDVQIAVAPNGQAWALTRNPNQIWHWDGQSWELYYEQKPLHRVKAFKFVSPVEAWAVGETIDEDGYTHGYIGFWDGDRWSEVKSPAVSTINDVVFLASDNGWTVGDGSQILHWNGKRWIESFAYIPRSSGWSADSYQLNAVSFLNPNDGWAVGVVDTEGGSTLYMLHWNGKTWDSLDRTSYPQLCTCSLFSIQSVNQNTAWATGSNGVSLYWNGDKWQGAKNPANRLLDEWHSSVSALSPSNAWRVGTGGMVLHWDGNVWKEIKNAPTSSMFTVTALSESEMIMAGARIYYWNSISWEELNNPVSSTEQVIVDLEVDPTGTIWAITNQGILLFLEKEVH